MSLKRFFDEELFRDNWQKSFTGELIVQVRNFPPPIWRTPLFSSKSLKFVKHARLLLGFHLAKGCLSR
jgi:hypothetical protein